MQFNMRVRMDNAAFKDEPATALSDIIEKARRNIMRGATEGTCFDANGNRVGEWEVSP